PLFEQGLDFTKAVFYLNKRSNPVGGQIGSQIGGQIGGQMELTPKQKEVYLLIKENPKISRKKMAIAMNINESALRKHLKGLKDKQMIKREGGTRGYWKILAPI